MNKIREFDLNIEKVLENWSVSDAIREIISNAIDEQILTSSKEIEIYQDEYKNWHIRDYGRGIKYIHFTQNENEEKLQNPNLIGKFGVGLKDALATFDRHNIKIKIISKFGIITLGKSHKYGFDDIVTLHAYIEENINRDFVGTDFVISNCSFNDIDQAKQMFLKFQNLKKFETTSYGEIYDNNQTSYIYINGLRVAEEENFLFSYNITSINDSIRKALNRERTNVGRSAYSGRVKQILLESKNQDVIQKLCDNLQDFNNGTMKDELA